MTGLATFTVDDIFIRVARLFGDESGVQITLDDVCRWLTDCVREIRMQNPEAFLESGPQPVSANQEFVAMSSFLSVGTTISAVYARSDPGSTNYYLLKALNKEQFDVARGGGFNAVSPQTGGPVIWTLSDGVILLYPVPARSDAQGLVIETIGNENFNIVPGDDLINILPLYYMNAVESYVLAKAYELDENMQASTYRAGLFQNDMDYYLGKRTWVGQRIFPTVTSYEIDDWC